MGDDLFQCIDWSHLTLYLSSWQSVIILNSPIVSYRSWACWKHMIPQADEWRFSLTYPVIRCTDSLILSFKRLNKAAAFLVKVCHIPRDWLQTKNLWIIRPNIISLSKKQRKQKIKQRRQKALLKIWPIYSWIVLPLFLMHRCSKKISNL